MNFDIFFSHPIMYLFYALSFITYFMSIKYIYSKPIIQVIGSHETCVRGHLNTTDKMSPHEMCPFITGRGGGALPINVPAILRMCRPT